MKAKKKAKPKAPSKGVVVSHELFDSVVGGLGSFVAVTLVRAHRKNPKAIEDAFKTLAQMGVQMGVVQSGNVQVDYTSAERALILAWIRSVPEATNADIVAGIEAHEHHRYQPPPPEPKVH